MHAELQSSRTPEGSQSRMEKRGLRAPAARSDRTGFLIILAHTVAGAHGLFLGLLWFEIGAWRCNGLIRFGYFLANSAPAFFERRQNADGALQSLLGFACVTF